MRDRFSEGAGAGKIPGAQEQAGDTPYTYKYDSTLPLDSSAQLFSQKWDSSQIRSQPNPFSSLST